MSINAALAVGNIVKRRIEEEIHRRETRGQSEAVPDAEDVVDADAYADDDDDVGDDDDDNAIEHSAEGDDDDIVSLPAEL
jgi:hypothetical protein